MKFAAVLMLVLVVCVGCTDGPYYRLVSVHSRGAATEVILARFWEKPTDWFWREASSDRFDYFVARVVGDQLLGVRSLERRQWDESAEFKPMVSTDRAYLHKLILPYEQKLIELASVSPGNRPRPLQEIPQSDFRLPKWAIAWTRDGRHLLIVDDSRLRIIDVESGRVIDESRDDPLVDLHRAIVEQFAGEGDWWLSDDLMHVIVAPPKEMYSHGLSQSPEGIRIDTGRVRFGEFQGAVYDRRSGSFAVYGLEVSGIPQSQWRLSIRDAEYVDGRVLLLYAGGRTLLVCTPNLSEQYLGSLQFATDDLYALVWTDWQPKHRRVTALECTDPQQLSIPGRGAPADWRLHRWFYDAGKTDTVTIRGDAVAKAIAAAK